MSWPDIVFSDEYKVKLKNMAELLEDALEKESNSFDELAVFAKYPPLVEAIKLAKEKKINSPLDLPNMNYWMCESPVSEWFYTGAGCSNLVSRFSLAISGFPYEEPN